VAARVNAVAAEVVVALSRGLAADAVPATASVTSPLPPTAAAAATTAAPSASAPVPRRTPHLRVRVPALNAAVRRLL